MDPTIVISVIVASITIVIGVFTTTYSKYSENKQSINSHFRDERVALLTSFMELFDGLFHGFYKGPKKQNRKSASKQDKPRDDDILRTLIETRRGLVHWCSGKSINKFDEFTDVMTNSAAQVKFSKPETPFRELAATCELYGELIYELRKDLGLSNRKISKKIFGYKTMNIKHYKPVLKAYKKNPDITIGEVTAIQNALDNDTS